MKDHQSISWSALEYFHQDKSSDWFWGLGIVATTAAVLAIVLGNTLFALVIVLFAFTASMQAHRKPREIDFQVTPRGVVVDHVLYPYSNLESFWITDLHVKSADPKILLRSKKLFMHFIHLPISDDDVDDVHNYLLQHLKEEELHESVFEKVLEYFGF